MKVVMSLKSWFLTLMMNSDQHGEIKKLGIIRY